MKVFNTLYETTSQKQFEGAFAVYISNSFVLKNTTLSHTNVIQGMVMGTQIYCWKSLYLEAYDKVLCCPPGPSTSWHARHDSTFQSCPSESSAWPSTSFLNYSVSNSTVSLCIPLFSSKEFWRSTEV